MNRLGLMLIVLLLTSQAYGLPPPPPYTFILENGLRVYHLKRGSAPGFADIVIQIDIGSNDEERSQAGMAHLVEHTVFLQSPLTEKRPLSELFNNAGIQFNASTSLLHTHYWSLLVPLPELERWCTRWADNILSPGMIPPAAFAMERQVVLEEMLLGIPDDVQTWETVSYSHLRHMFAAFSPGPTYPLWSPIGFRRSVGAITARDIVRFKQEKYKPAAMKLIIGADCDKALIERVTRTAFGRFYQGRVNKPEKHARQFNISRPSDFKVIESPTLLPGHIGFLLGFAVPSEETEDGFLCDRLVQILNQRIVRKSYRNYTITVGIENGRRGVGERLLIIMADINNVLGNQHQFPQLEEEVSSLLRIASDHPPVQGEIDYLTYQERLRRTYESHAMLLARSLTFSTVDAFLSEQVRLAKLTPESLHQTAHRYLNPAHAVSVIHGEGRYLFELKNTVTVIMILGCGILPLLLIIGLHFSWSRWLSDESGTLYLIRPIQRTVIVLTRLAGWICISIIVLVLVTILVQITFSIVMGKPAWTLWYLIPLLSILQIGSILLYIGILFSLGRAMPSLILSILLWLTGTMSKNVLDISQDLDSHPALRFVLDGIYHLIPKIDQIQDLAMEASLGMDAEHVTGMIVVHFLILPLIVMIVGLATFARREFR